MKYLVILTDGAADRPYDEIGGKTALEAADMKCADHLAAHGEVGTVKTVPEGMAPGSDVANLSVMGYAPEKYHTGRSPLEAASMGIDMLPTDVAFRCNLITVEGDGPYEELTIKDHSAGDISNEEAAELIRFINDRLGTDRIQFYPGRQLPACYDRKGRFHGLRSDTASRRSGTEGGTESAEGRGRGIYRRDDEKEL